MRPDDRLGAGKVEGEVGAAPAEPVRPRSLVALLGPAHSLGDHALVLGAPDGDDVAALAGGRLAAVDPASASAASVIAAAAAALGHGSCPCPRFWITFGSLPLPPWDLGSLVLIWDRLF